MDTDSAVTRKVDATRAQFYEQIERKNGLQKLMLTVENLTELVEELSVKNKDNKSLLYQLFSTQLEDLEGRIDKKLANLRVDLSEKVKYRYSEMFTFVPEPGFVLKTKKVSTLKKEKVFINVFHHPCIEFDPPAFLRRSHQKIFILIGDHLTTVDKEGVGSVLFHVCVSSEFFRVPYVRSDVKISDDRCVHQVRLLNFVSTMIETKLILARHRTNLTCRS